MPPAAMPLPQEVLFIQALGPTAASIGTLLVAIVVTIVAWRQWRTAQDKLALDLFDKRFQLYQDMIEGLMAIDGWSRSELNNAYFDLGNRALFLFGEPFKDTVLELMSTALAKGRDAKEYHDQLEAFLSTLQAEMAMPTRRKR